MIRQTRNYLRGALSGTALIGVAVIAFVLLVSLQTVRDWPFAGLVGGGEAGTSAAEAGGPQGATATAATASASTPDTSGGGGGGAGAGADADGKGGAAPGTGTGTPASEPTGGAPRGGDIPVSDTGGDGAAQGGSSGRSGGGGSSRPSSGGGGGGGGGGGSQPSGGGGESVSETVTGTVNETVKGVDEATGGVLGEAGVTETTEDVVDGVAGPDSTVGKTVDKTTEKVKDTVGGLLGGDE